MTGTQHLATKGYATAVLPPKLSSWTYCLPESLGNFEVSIFQPRFLLSDHDPISNLPGLHWSENEIFQTVTTTSSGSLKPPNSITSTLKDYRPPKILAAEAANNKGSTPSTTAVVSAVATANSTIALPKIGTASSGRYATTIYKCQVCTKAFATIAFLEEHMKTHIEKINVTNVSNPIKKKNEKNFECSSCHKSFQTKETLKSHFQVRIYWVQGGRKVRYRLSILSKCELFWNALLWIQTLTHPGVTLHTKVAFGKKETFSLTHGLWRMPITNTINFKVFRKFLSLFHT